MSPREFPGTPKIKAPRPPASKGPRPSIRGFNLELFPVEATYKVERKANGMPVLKFSPTPPERGGLPDALWLHKTESRVTAISLEETRVIYRARTFSQDEPLVRDVQFKSRREAETAFGSEIQKIIAAENFTKFTKYNAGKEKRAPVHYKESPLDPEVKEAFLEEWAPLIGKIARAFTIKENEGLDANDLEQELRLKALYIRAHCGESTGHTILKGALLNYVSTLAKKRAAQKRAPAEGYIYIDAPRAVSGEGEMSWHETFGDSADAEDIDDHMGRATFAPYRGYYFASSREAKAIVRLICPPAYLRLAGIS